jgi:hypothetical protein
MLPAALLMTVAALRRIRPVTITNQFLIELPVLVPRQSQHKIDLVWNFDVAHRACRSRHVGGLWMNNQLILDFLRIYIQAAGNDHKALSTAAWLSQTVAYTVPSKCSKHIGLIKYCQYH